MSDWWNDKIAVYTGEAYSSPSPKKQVIEAWLRMLCLPQRLELIMLLYDKSESLGSDWAKWCGVVDDFICDNGGPDGSATSLFIRPYHRDTIARA